MRTQPKKSIVAKAKATATQATTSQAIAEQTAAFLASGGQIIKIRSGLREQEVESKQV
jgi:hypothetical protein